MQVSERQFSPYGTFQKVVNKYKCYEEIKGDKTEPNGDAKSQLR